MTVTEEIESCQAIDFNANTGLSRRRDYLKFATDPHGGNPAATYSISGPQIFAVEYFGRFTHPATPSRTALRCPARVLQVLPPG